MQSGDFTKATAALWSLFGLSSAELCCIAQTGASPTNGQTHPGVQSGNRATDATFIKQPTDPNGLTAFFQDGLNRFHVEEAVSNSPTGSNGFAPRFNSNQCSSCHTQPAVGGSGAAVNLQFQLVNLVNNDIPPRDTIPSIVTVNGSTREARFPSFFNSQGQVDAYSWNGGVEDLFSVSGRSNAGWCNLAQPNFAAAEEANNTIFRIHWPVFSTGLLENLDDSTLRKNQAVNLNMQNNSLHSFAGETYNVGIVINNDAFPQHRSSPEEDQHGTRPSATCLNFTGIGYLEDTYNPTSELKAAVLDDVSGFGTFGLLRYILVQSYVGNTRL